MNKKYYFIGIKGSGMSSLAHIMKDFGNEVAGSDIEEFVFTEEKLKERNIKIESFEKNIDDENWIYVIGNNFNEQNNQQVKTIKEKKYSFITYHNLLGQLSLDKCSIAVSGVHGKTSTTNLLSQLLDAIEGTSYLIGDGNGKGNNESDYFVFEACEYKNSFLFYKPYYAIITNMEMDHPDFFKNEKQVIASFSEFVKKVRKNVFVYGDDYKYKNLDVREISKIITYGFEAQNHYQAINVEQKENGVSFGVLFKGKDLGEFSFPIFGKHNIMNALSAIAVMNTRKIDLKKINEFSSKIKNAKRRFQIETFEGYTWINDYAHHPTEITATIEATRQKFPNKKVIAIFQPHTYTRVETFKTEFQESLGKADKVYGIEIFGSAREKKSTIEIENLLENIEGSEKITLESIKELKKYKNDILLFMSAGDIEKYINEFKIKITEEIN